MRYIVTIRRDSLYAVEAESEDAAIDAALEGTVEEIPGGETVGAWAGPEEEWASA